jgi:hypothetical protein
MKGKNVSVVGTFMPYDIISGQSACHDLHNLLEASLGRINLEIDHVQIPVDIDIFSRGLPVVALMDAIASHPHANKESNREQNLQCIWRSALMRTSSHPVDMVFSTMGIFDVFVDPSSFLKNDRLGATIALAKAILKKGGKPSWIGATYSLDPCPQLSTFPQFPETSVAGKAYLRLPDGSRKQVLDVMADRISAEEYLVDIPAGSMDDEGYLTMHAHAVRVSRVSPPLMGGSEGCMTTIVHEVRQVSPLLMGDSEVVASDGSFEDSDQGEDDTPTSADFEHETEGVTYESVVIQAEDGSSWEIHDVKGTPSNPPSFLFDSAAPITYLVYLGQAVQTLSPAFGRAHDLQSLKCWVVQEHSPGKFHRIASLNVMEMYDNLITSLSMIDLSVGGPLSWRGS